MKDLKCGQKNCKYNKGYCCCAKQISVSKGADCTSYTFDAKNASLFEAGSDFMAVNYSVDTKVACVADCLFQNDSKCIANGITVMDDDRSKATCHTFVKDKR